MDLAIETSGLVRTIDFAPNAVVTEGQVLLKMDDKAERAGLAVTKATRAQTLSSRGVRVANTLETAEAQVESELAQAQLQTVPDATHSPAHPLAVWSGFRGRAAAQSRNRVWRTHAAPTVYQNGREDGMRAVALARIASASTERC